MLFKSIKLWPIQESIRVQSYKILFSKHLLGNLFSMVFMRSYLVVEEPLYKILTNEGLMFNVESELS